MEDRREETVEMCRCYGVERLDLFGSAAKGQGGGFDPEKSDLDFVVSFVPRTPARLFDRYFGLKEDLEELSWSPRPTRSMSGCRCGLSGGLNFQDANLVAI